MFWCTNCLNTSTRPRITFDKNGLCNACQWANEKKKINWKIRQSVLKKIFSNKKNNYDCIVPVSGGKDGSYVAYTLKKKFNINPLCVTIRPPLELELGNTNLRNFINAGFDHIHVSPNNLGFVIAIDKASNHEKFSGKTLYNDLILSKSSI